MAIISSKMILLTVNLWKIFKMQIEWCFQVQQAAYMYKKRIKNVENNPVLILKASFQENIVIEKILLLYLSSVPLNDLQTKD